MLILMELCRLLIFYLREHRISVALTVEVALVSTLREVMLKGAHEFEWLRLVGLSLLLVVLGGLLVTERWMGRPRPTPVDAWGVFPLRAVTHDKACPFLTSR